MTKDGVGIGVTLRWEGRAEAFLPSSTLRRSCPCATCLEKRGDRTHEKPLLPRKSALRVIDATVAEAENLVAIFPVGNYALGFRWGDGHDSGIYSFEQLFALSADSPIAAADDSPGTGAKSHF